MKLQWCGYYPQYDGYGRFNYRMLLALRGLGVKVKALTLCHLDLPPDMQEAEGMDWSGLTITCTPPFSFRKLPGRQWVFTMTEGSRIPQEWVEKIERSEIERVIVPCEHNRQAFQASGVTVPISVVPGGVDPVEFPVTEHRRSSYRPYTFLTFADRGSRKGWEEVWAAFYKAFGGKTTGIQDVRLVIKSRPGPDRELTWMSKAENPDTRISYQTLEAESMLEVYRQADCLVLPSRSEGWGMIQREAACTGLPVITQKYSGLDDGCTEQWALVVEGGKLQPIAMPTELLLGEWMVANTDNLAQVMRWAYYSPETAAGFGVKAARWLREHQTWRHAAMSLACLIEGQGYG